MAGLTSAMADVASKAADTVKGIAASVDPKTAEPPALHGKVAIVTGANAGLGYEASLSMAKAGAHVILATRNDVKGEDAARQIQQEVDAVNGGGKVDNIHLDLASLKSVKSFADEFLSRNLPLHILINNAGEFVPKDNMTEDGFEVTIGTNHFGPYYLTQQLLGKLKENTPSRVVWVTSPSESSTPDIDWDNLEAVGQPSDLRMYGLSKLYNLVMMKEFQRRLQNSGVEVFAAQPGIARTEIFGKIDANLSKPLGTALKLAGPIIGQTAEEGARSLVYAATSPDMAGKGGDLESIVGPPYARAGPLTPEGSAGIIANIGNTGERDAQNPRAYDDALTQRLYDETARILSHKIKSFDGDREWL